jgi:hypothetical protein
MSAKKRKTSKKRPSQKIVDGRTLRGYQEPELFKAKFQRSATCHSFRRAWNIPPDGFRDYGIYSTFHTDLREKDRDFAKSEECLKHHAKLIESRKAWAKGKITNGDLDIAERRFAHFIHSVKYDEDLDLVVHLSKKPVYWRSFIEGCLLFRDARPTLVTRPLPEPKVLWSNDLQRNELTIGNIFPDTTAKDFTDRRFTEKLKELQKRLPGYGPRPRSKKSFSFGMKVLELENSGLSNQEKADKIAGINIDSEDFMKSPREDLKSKNRVKTMQRRMKKRTGLT